MKTLTASSLFAPVAPLFTVCLLFPAMAFTEPIGSAEPSPSEDSSYTHGRIAMQDDGSASGTPHHGKMASGDSGAHHAAHTSGHGKGYAKGHGDRGAGSRHARTHQNAAAFMDHILKFKDGMNLTDNQAQQLRDLKTQYQKSRITMKADVQLASLDLHEVLKDDQAGLADIEAQLNNVHALKTKLYMASIQAKRHAMTVLSEEQQSRMKQIHERIKSHGGHDTYRKQNAHKHE